MGEHLSNVSTNARRTSHHSVSPRTTEEAVQHLHTLFCTKLLISTFWDLIRALEEAFQMPLIMDVILNYSLWIFFLAMSLLSSTNFLLHPRTYPIKPQMEVRYAKEKVNWKLITFFFPLRCLSYKGRMWVRVHFFSQLNIHHSVPQPLPVLAEWYSCNRWAQKFPSLKPYYRIQGSICIFIHSYSF